MMEKCWVKCKNQNQFIYFRSSYTVITLSNRALFTVKFWDFQPLPEYLGVLEMMFGVLEGMVEGLGQTRVWQTVYPHERKRRHGRFVDSRSPCQVAFSAFTSGSGANYSILSRLKPTFFLSLLWLWYSKNDSKRSTTRLPGGRAQTSLTIFLPQPITAAYSLRPNDTRRAQNWTMEAAFSFLLDWKICQ